MYLDFYKLHLKPFQISTDPKFLWLGEKHKEALAVLKYGILDNKGFLLLTGDVGTGKTTLLNALIESLGEDVLVALVTDPGLAKMDFFNFVADSFEMDKNFRSKGEFLIYLKNFLLDVNRQNKQTLLIIDECQHLNQKLLEEVRLLSNIEKQNTKLINIFFVGQSEFNEIILRPRNRAIRQRITINYNISALSESETDKYIRFRLGVAGSKDAIFTSRAIKEVYKFSNGFPRLINIICDQALLTGYVKEKKKIDHKIVAECSAELKIPHGMTTKKSMATPEAAETKPLEQSVTEIAAEPLSDASRRQYSKPLVIAFIVVVIIWIGLVTTFFLYQQQGATTLTMGTAPGPSGSVTSLETRKSETSQVATSTGTTKVDSGGPGDSMPITRSTAPGSSSQRTALETNDAAASNLNQGTDVSTQLSQPSATSIDKDKTDNGLSLSDIKESFGEYPEILFEFNSNQLEKEAYDMLGLIARYCAQHPETALVLRGYTDRAGVRSYNLKLSEFRADMVKTYLVGKGVRADAITTLGLGPDAEGPDGTTIAYDGTRRKVVVEILSPTE